MTAQAKTMVIVSTLVGPAYAASEALWHALSIAAVGRGWEVRASIAGAARGSLQTMGLESSGVRLLYRSFPGRGLVTRYLQRLQDYSIGPWLLRRQVPSMSSLVVVNLGSLLCAADVPIYYFLKSLRSPYVLLIHSNSPIAQYSERTVNRLREALKQSVRNYFVSRRLIDDARWQLMMDFSNASLVKNPANLKSVEIIAWPKCKTVRMAVVGRLDAWNKGHIRLLDVLSREKWRDRDWSLSIFGEGPDKSRIDQAIRFFGLANRVALRGHVGDIGEEIWARHQVLVMPSLFEGMSLAMVEAMVCGRVVVASDVGGATEIVTNNKTGFIANSPFPAQLDEALENMWTRRGELEAIGVQAHAAALNYVPADAGVTLLDELEEAVP